MKEYNKILTNDEQQKQYLSLIVKKCRSSLPDKNKNTMISLKLIIKIILVSAYGKLPL